MRMCAGVSGVPEHRMGGGAGGEPGRGRWYGQVVVLQED